MHTYNTYNAYIHTHQVNKCMMIKLFSDKCYENQINQNKMIKHESATILYRVVREGLSDNEMYDEMA